MKYLLILLFLMSTLIAAESTSKGYIDMHGGKNSSLVPKGSNKFGDKNMGMSNFLNSKKDKNIKIIKKDKKVEKQK